MRHLDHVGRIAATLAAVMILSTALGHLALLSGEPGLVAAAAVTLICVHLIAPFPDSPPWFSAYAPILQSFTATHIFLLACLVMPGDLVLESLPSLALAVAVLAWFLASAATLFGYLFKNASAARLWVLLLAIIIGAVPLWLGRLFEAVPSLSPWVDPLLAINPLAYLSVMTDWDFLRYEWFYRNTPWGSLHFSYPAAGAATAAYLMLGLLCHGTIRLLRHTQDTSLSITQ